MFFVFVDLEKSGKYDGTLLRDLLRAITDMVNTMYYPTYYMYIPVS